MKKTPTPIGKIKKDCSCCEFDHGMSSFFPYYLDGHLTCRLCGHKLVGKSKKRWLKQIEEYRKPSPTPASKNITTGPVKVAVSYVYSSTLEPTCKCFIDMDKKLHKCKLWPDCQRSIEGHCMHNPIMVCEACQPTEEKECVFRACPCDIGEWWCQTHEQHKEDCPPQQIEKELLCYICGVESGKPHKSICSRGKSEPLDKGMDWEKELVTLFSQHEIEVRRECYGLFLKTIKDSKKHFPGSKEFIIEADVRDIEKTLRALLEDK